jgi:hypothetical protein
MRGESISLPGFLVYFCDVAAMATLPIGGIYILFYILDDDRRFPKQFLGSPCLVSFLVSLSPPAMYCYALTYWLTGIV